MEGKLHFHRIKPYEMANRSMAAKHFLNFANTTIQAHGGKNEQPVFWADFICSFLVEEAMVDFDQLSPGEIEELMQIPSSFDCFGFSPKWPAGNLVFGDHLDEVRDNPPPH